LRVQYEGEKGDVIVTDGLMNDKIGYLANLPFWGSAHHRGDRNKITCANVGIIAGDAEHTAKQVRQAFHTQTETF
jgi:hypothetical protein